MKTKHKTFKPFDRIIVRDCKSIWQIDFYSHWSEEYKQHVTLAFGDGLKIDDNDILPFEGNEDLVGKVDEHDEDIMLEEGEWIVCFDYINHCNSAFSFGLAKFTVINSNLFYVSDCNAWKYAIRFSDFNPNDMKETKKHILCVKNGKVVKYHGKD